MQPLFAGRCPVENFRPSAGNQRRVRGARWLPGINVHVAATRRCDCKNRSSYAGSGRAFQRRREREQFSESSFDDGRIRSAKRRLAAHIFVVAESAGRKRR